LGCFFEAKLKMFAGCVHRRTRKHKEGNRRTRKEIEGQERLWCSIRLRNFLVQKLVHSPEIIRRDVLRISESLKHWIVGYHILKDSKDTESIDEVLQRYKTPKE
jgi:hypothetical protein